MQSKINHLFLDIFLCEFCNVVILDFIIWIFKPQSRFLLANYAKFVLTKTVCGIFYWKKLNYKWKIRCFFNFFFDIFFYLLHFYSALFFEFNHRFNHGLQLWVYMILNHSIHLFCLWYVSTMLLRTIRSSNANLSFKRFTVASRTVIVFAFEHTHLLLWKISKTNFTTFFH